MSYFVLQRPTSNWRKNELREWLCSKNVECAPTMLRVDLLELAKRNMPPKSYVVDNLATAAGHTLLRLPPYHCALNPIELVWADVKGYIARKNVTFTFPDLQGLLAEGISQVTPEKWKKCIDHVVQTMEPEMWRLDGIVDVLVEPMIINFDDDDDSDIVDDPI